MSVDILKTAIQVMHPTYSSTKSGKASNQATISLLHNVQEQCWVMSVTEGKECTLSNGWLTNEFGEQHIELFFSERCWQVVEREVDF